MTASLTVSCCPCQVLMAEEADEDPAAAAASQAAAAASAATAFEKPQGGGTGTLLASQLAAQLAPWREGAGGKSGVDAAAASLRIVRNPDLRGAAPMFVQPAPRAKPVSADTNGTASTQSRPGAASGSASASRVPSAGEKQSLPAPAPDHAAATTANTSSRTAHKRPPGLQGESSTPQPPQAVSAPDRSTGQPEAGLGAGAEGRRERRRGDGRTRGRRPAGGGSSASASPAVSRASSPGPAQRVRLVLSEPTSRARSQEYRPLSPLSVLSPVLTTHLPAPSTWFANAE